MSSLTLFIIPNDTPKLSDATKTAKSFGDLLTEKVVLDHRRLHEIEKVETTWWAYMFDNEGLDENLKKVLTAYLHNELYDCYQLYKRVLVADGDKAKARFFISPRVFKAHIRMQKDIFLPENPDLLRTINVLDGWIVNHDLESLP